MANALVWFRNDLRLADNPALRAALDGDYAPIPIYIHAPDEEGAWTPGAASEAWRHHALAALAADLEARGAALRLFAGPSLQTLQSVAAASGAEAVFWNRRYEPAAETRDAAIKKKLRTQGIRAESHNGALLLEPWDVATKQGDPYRVFTPFWKSVSGAWRRREPWDPPARFDAPADVEAIPQGVALDALKLAPALGWDAGFWQRFAPGEAGAHAALDAFIAGPLRGYRDSRDRPGEAGTSRLSPHLHFGGIAPWRIVHALEAVRDADTAEDIDTYVRELGWREFAHHLLHHFPHTTDENLNPRFADFPWAKVKPAQLEAWRRGTTGVPIVDAGLRELWHTGWMHNRVRMIVGSYLTKHLRYHWLEGARWFWDTLVDADLANNTLGWQWIGGTGADAAPYYRIFNPVTQAERFDPDAAYITRWVPELAALPVAARFAPWQHAALLKRHAPGYPRKPLVDLAEGRDAALAAYKASK